jgi:hypothetical protein
MADRLSEYPYAPPGQGSQRHREVRPGEFAPEVVLASPAGGGSGLPGVATTASLVDLPEHNLLSASSSGSMDVSQFRQLFVVADVTALVGGVTPTVAFFLEREYVPGKWTALYSPSALTGAGRISQSIGGGLETARSIGRTIRLRWTVSGAPTTATADLHIEAKS